MHNNPATELTGIPHLAKSYFNTMQQLIGGHIGWLSKVGPGVESNFQEALEHSIRVSEELSRTPPQTETGQLEKNQQLLIHELRNILRMCDTLADQYIAEKNREYTANITRFKEVVNQFYVKLNKVAER
jgi:hypothetical protein